MGVGAGALEDDGVGDGVTSAEACVAPATTTIAVTVSAATSDAGTMPHLARRPAPVKRSRVLTVTPVVYRLISTLSVTTDNRQPRGHPCEFPRGCEYTTVTLACS